MTDSNPSRVGSIPRGKVWKFIQGVSFFPVLQVFSEVRGTWKASDLFSEVLSLRGVPRGQTLDRQFLSKRCPAPPTGACRRYPRDHVFSNPVPRVQTRFSPQPPREAAALSCRLRLETKSNTTGPLRGQPFHETDAVALNRIAPPPRSS